MKYGKHALVLPSGSVLSVDNVVAEYSLKKGGAEQFLRFVESKLLWQYQHGECLGGIGKFRHRFTFDFGQESTFTVLLGFYGSSGSIQPDKVRVDVNPNKVDCAEFYEVLDFLKTRSKTSRLVRYDLAYDFEAEREHVMLIRTDARKREYTEISLGNYTEYLGSRNVPGRYKLYNKTIESGLSVPLVRSELTCDGTWTAEDVLAKFPIVYHIIPSFFVDDFLSHLGNSYREVFLKMLVRHPEEAYLLDAFYWREKKSLISILGQCSQDSSSVHSVLTVSMVQGVMTSLHMDMIT